MSLTIHSKYKYFDSTVQRAEVRRQKFHFCRLPFAVNVMLNLSNSILCKFHAFVVEDSRFRQKIESGPNYTTAAHAFVKATLRLGLRAPFVARKNLFFRSFQLALPLNTYVEVLNTSVINTTYDQVVIFRPIYVFKWDNRKKYLWIA